MILVIALAFPALASVEGKASIQQGCVLRGGMFFETRPNQFGRYPVQMNFGGACFDRLDVERDIPININLFLVGSARSLGQCTGSQYIQGLDLNGFYSYAVEGESGTINIEAEEWSRSVFPGPMPFKLMIRYDGTQPEILPVRGVFAAGFVSTRVYGMCPNGGDPRAQMRMVYSRQP